MKKTNFTKNAVNLMANKDYSRGDDIFTFFKKKRKRIECYPQYGRGLGKRIEAYSHMNAFCMSTPQLANFGAFTREEEAEMGSVPCPASCHVISVDDKISDIVGAYGETGKMSQLGGGVGIDYYNVGQGGVKNHYGLPRNSKLDWIEDTVGLGNKICQGNSIRRGYVVPYLDLTDNDFWEMQRRVDQNRSKQDELDLDPLANNNVGWRLPDNFRDKIQGKTDLAQADLDELRKRYRTVLKKRKIKGSQYLVNRDNCKKNISPVYEALGLVPDRSNICTEIMTPFIEGHSFTCVLSALNLKYWDYIKENPQIIWDAIAFLDICVEEFIRLTEGLPHMEKARRSAIEKRDIGLGTMGYHDLLRSKKIVFGSLEERRLNNEIQSFIMSHAEKASEELGKQLGSPLLCKEAGIVRRNVSLRCIAPNKTTSEIYGGVCGGIEPKTANIFIKTLAGIHTTYRDPYLEQLLIEKGRNTNDVWDEVMNDHGTVRSLDFLSDHEKAYLRTAQEVSPKDLIDSVSVMQKHVDQAISLNLRNRANYTEQDIYNLHDYAWQRDVKTLYYYYSAGHAANQFSGGAWNECESCAN